MKAFLSHTGANKVLVRLVHERLTRENAWFDAVDIENGDSIPEKISEGLRGATHFVLFWSKEASNAPWVRAELNSAFMRTMSNKCKLMIFNLDGTALPELYQQYKYDLFNKTDLREIADDIANTILSQKDIDVRISEFINRSKEISDIEDAIRKEYKLVILNGILGIGKSSLAKKAFLWLYPNSIANIIVIDFNSIPGIAELVIEFSNKLGKKLINTNKTYEEQKQNLRFYLECISSSSKLLILKDVKSWLNEDGHMGEALSYIVELIIDTVFFDYPVIMTSSRFVSLTFPQFDKVKQFTIKGMSDSHIAQIIKNNLPPSLKSDDEKNMEFSKHIYGYPLGAKLGACNISNQGYNYYLEQPYKVQELKVGIAKQLITYSHLTEKCIEYLKIIALAKSRLHNEEYVLIFPELNDISTLADEAYFSGLINLDDDGCYKLELLVSDYFYDLAFTADNRKDICKRLETFLLNAVSNENDKNYMRLIPVAIHILTLNGKIGKAKELRSELTSTIKSSMWDQYNHGEYEDAMKTACSLIDLDSSDYDAQYVRALCLTRFDKYDEAWKLLKQLQDVDQLNSSRYYYALGRIEKRKGLYNNAIELFMLAYKTKKHYLSPYREVAECYLYMDSLSEAKNAINKAKEIDSSNIFVLLIEARILQKENNLDTALDLLSHQTLVEHDFAPLLFRCGRIYDQKGDIETAKKCYEHALKKDSKTYDAELCLLSHQILEEPEKAKNTINKLKTVLQGKRKYILMNIEARFVGYQENDNDKALEILDKVPDMYKDKQWFAVRIQLIQNIIFYHREKGRVILAQEYEKQLNDLQQKYAEKYGTMELLDADFLPDA